MSGEPKGILAIRLGEAQKKNDQERKAQYRITKAQVRAVSGCSQAEVAGQARLANVSVRLWEAQRAAVAQSQMEELAEQVEAYERL